MICYWPRSLSITRNTIPLSNQTTVHDITIKLHAVLCQPSRRASEMPAKIPHNANMAAALSMATPKKKIHCQPSFAGPWASTSENIRLASSQIPISPKAQYKNTGRGGAGELVFRSDCMVRRLHLSNVQILKYHKVFWIYSS